MDVKKFIFDLSKEELLEAINNSYYNTQVLRRLGLEVTETSKKWFKRRIQQEEIEIQHFKKGRCGEVWEPFKEEFKQLVEESTSYSDLQRKIGLEVTGGNLRTIKERIALDNLSVNHMEETRYNHDKTKMSLEEILVKNSPYKSTKALKDRLIKEGLLENKCVKCNVGPVWQGEPLSLELDHIDGDNKNNEIENLRILCPNCHSQTETFGGKNVKKQKKVHLCIECSSIVYKGSRLCVTCANFKMRKQERPSKEELLQLILTKSFLEIANIYNVSDNAIRNWCKDYNLPVKKEDILRLKSEMGILNDLNESGYRGVSKQRDKWKASISIKGKHQHIAIFDTPEEAAEAYDMAALEFHGEKAITNKSLGLI